MRRRGYGHYQPRSSSPHPRSYLADDDDDDISMVSVDGGVLRTDSR